MSLTSPVINNWIYDTLSADLTLQELLAVNNEPPGYQQSIYADMAPQIDVISNELPQLPYIVFGLESEVVDKTICGSPAIKIDTYRITVWDTAVGAISYSRAWGILDRVEYLLDRKRATVGTVDLFATKESTSQTYDFAEGGRVDVAVSGIYTIATLE